MAQDQIARRETKGNQSFCWWGNFHFVNYYDWNWHGEESGQVAEREFLSLSSSINAKVEEARSIGDLNPDRARHLFSQSKNEVTAYLMTDIREEYKMLNHIETVSKGDWSAIVFKK